MAFSANGSSITFAGSAIGEVVSINYTENGADIQVTDLGDSNHAYEVGILDQECSIEINGDEATHATFGDTGALSISWNSGGSSSMASAVVTSVDTSGSLDDKVTTTITFKPTK